MNYDDGARVHGIRQNQDMSPDALLHQLRLRATLTKLVIEELSPRQAEVIFALYFGECTSADFGRDEGLSRGLASTTANNALAKLKRFRRQLREF